MMSARLIGIMFCLGGGIVGARSADDSATGLESCFHAARLADTICSKLDAAQRLDCFSKARAAQLECLDRVLANAPGAPAAAGNPPGTEGPGPSSVSPNVSPEGTSRRENGQTGSAKMTIRSAPAKESDGPPNAVGQTAPGLKEFPEGLTGSVRSDTPSKTAHAPTQPNWVVSETTSPIDYSPLVTALIRSTSEIKDAPSILAVRCAGNHTELSIRTEGAWGTTHGNELRVDYQINDKPIIGLQWALSADGKSAKYKDDPVGLLQSLPDGTRLKVKVTDQGHSSHEAMFQLDGWDIIRKKIATACKWARPTGRTSSDQR
jgi:hypothetical protein